MMENVHAIVMLLGACGFGGVMINLVMWLDMSRDHSLPFHIEEWRMY